MTKLSVNINKVATLRNARGGNTPNLLQFASDCERFGADGITVHPRPDERHIRYDDVRELSSIVTTEFNIEGNPTDRFLALVQEVKPVQCTLVPDAPNAITSDAGWDTIKEQDRLREIVAKLQSWGCRTSLFIEPDLALLDVAAQIGTDRVEFYTGPYAQQFQADREGAVNAYKTAAVYCNKLGLGINAGHDLSLENLSFFKQNMEGLQEVSIGHALICDSLYLGIENTIQLYKRELSS